MDLAGMGVLLMVRFWTDVVGFKNKASDKGFLLLGVLILMVVTLIVVFSLTSSKRMEAKLTAASNKLNTNSYLIEESISQTVAWLQGNSEYFVSPFLAANFNTYFDLVSLSSGSNDGPYLTIPSVVKNKGTSNSVILSNYEALGTSAFPNTTHIVTEAAFNPVEAFQSADLGQAKVRLTLTGLGSSGTDKQPIFKLDVTTEDLAFHSSAYIYGRLTSSTSTYAAFFSTTGPITLDSSNNSCKSYNWSFDGTTWSKGSHRSNCSIASDSNIVTKGHIDGNLLTNASALILPPVGNVAGTICQQQPTCHGLMLSNFDTWSTTCSAEHQGDLTISSNTSLTVISDNPANNCWRDVIINSDSTLTLNTLDIPYHFRTITFADPNSSRLAFTNIPIGQYINLYVENFSGNSISGKKLDNQNNAPHQVRLNITGSNALDLIGSSQMQVDLTAPDNQVNLSGNFNFYGGIKAKQIYATDNVTLNADEAILGVGPISKMNFSIGKLSNIAN